MSVIQPLEIKVPTIEIWSTIVPILLSKANGRKIWCLKGDLGAGKTTFVQALMGAFDSQDDVSSPTFSLVNEYQGRFNDKDLRIYHLDLYRLHDVEELLDIGFEEIMEDGDLVLIEWPELAAPLLPEHVFALEFVNHDNQRKVLVL